MKTVVRFHWKNNTVQPFLRTDNLHRAIFLVLSFHGESLGLLDFQIANFVELEKNVRNHKSSDTEAINK